MIFAPLLEPRRIVTLPKLVAGLSTPDRPLSVDPELANEAIYLRGITVDASLLPKVAKACAAEWVTVGNRSCLIRSKALKATLASKEKADLLAALKASFQSPKKQLDALTLTNQERNLKRSIDAVHSSWDWGSEAGRRRGSERLQTLSDA
ncbi:hypothetical protein BH11ARM2_BH11ARM2_04500 [soil metagenome]